MQEAMDRGDLDEARRINQALQRETARAATKGLLPNGIKGHLDETVRARFTGRTFVDVVQDLVKGCFSDDAGGQSVLAKWEAEAAKAGVMNSVEFAKKVVDHYARRAAGDRERMAWALVELEVRHAEALSVDPLEFAKPIWVSAVPEPEPVADAGGSAVDPQEIHDESAPDKAAE